jgi:hypothetical protein
MDDNSGVPDADGLRGVGLRAWLREKAIRKNEPVWRGWRFVLFGLRLVPRFLLLVPSFRISFSFKKSWSAPLPDKPSDRGLFGLPEDTGAAPITGAPAAHCFRLWLQEPRGNGSLATRNIMGMFWFSIAP